MSANTTFAVSHSIVNSTSLFAFHTNSTGGSLCPLRSPHFVQQHALNQLASSRAVADRRIGHAVLPLAAPAEAASSASLERTTFRPISPPQLSNDTTTSSPLLPAASSGHSSLLTPMPQNGQIAAGIGAQNLRMHVLMTTQQALFQLNILRVQFIRMPAKLSPALACWLNTLLPQVELYQVSARLLMRASDETRPFLNALRTPVLCRMLEHFYFDEMSHSPKNILIAAIDQRCAYAIERAPKYAEENLSQLTPWEQTPLDRPFQPIPISRGTGIITAERITGILNNVTPETIADVDMLAYRFDEVLTDAPGWFDDEACREAFLGCFPLGMLALYERPSLVSAHAEKIFRLFTQKLAQVSAMDQYHIIRYIEHQLNFLNSSALSSRMLRYSKILFWHAGFALRSQAQLAQAPL